MDRRRVETYSEVASDEDRPLCVLPVKVAELPSNSFNNEQQSNFRSSWFIQLVLLVLELGRQEGKESKFLV